MSTDATKSESGKSDAKKTDTDKPVMPPLPPLDQRKIESVVRNSAGELVVRLKDYSEAIVDARVARCFPWSLPATYVSVRDKDGKELVLLRALDELDEISRAVVSKELDEKVFNPQIQRVVEFKSEFGVTSIKASTDRGEVTFQIRSRDDVRVLSPSRALFRDADGNTYEVADLAVLDKPSQRHLAQYF